MGEVYNAKHSAGYGSVVKLVKASKTKKLDVEEWLSGQNTYNLHKTFRKRFPRDPHTVTNIDDVREMDLADISSLSKYNEKYKHLLNVIDTFSRYAWSFPLKDKSSTSNTTALKLFRFRKPITIKSDKGTQFSNITLNIRELIFIQLQSRNKGRH